jgi:hypothetical protein
MKDKIIPIIAIVAIFIGVVLIMFGRRPLPDTPGPIIPSQKVEPKPEPKRPRPRPGNEESIGQPAPPIPEPECKSEAISEKPPESSEQYKPVPWEPVPDLPVYEAPPEQNIEQNPAPAQSGTSGTKRIIIRRRRRF